MSRYLPPGHVPFDQKRPASKGTRHPRRRGETMPTKTKKRPLRTRTPSRVKKRKPTTRRARPKSARPSHQHPELAGLGLLAVGLFLGAVLYLGVGGGVGGAGLVHGIEAVVGSMVYGFPPALAPLRGPQLFRGA